MDLKTWFKSVNAEFFIPLLFVCIAFLTGCSHDKSSNPVEPEKATALTIMIYLDADNDLESYAMDDIKEMKNGMVDNQGTNLIILIDRIPGYSYDSSKLGEDFTGTRIYRVSSEYAWRKADPEYLNLSGSGDNEELNMGDAQVLKSFIQYCKAEYTADKYALILWNHGGGPRKREISRDFTVSVPVREVCSDWTSDDDLYTAEITDALTADESVGLIGFDACYMGSVEVAYQFRPGNGGFNAQVMVASPPTEWGFGWRYDRWLERLKSGGGNNGTIDTVMGGLEEFYDPLTLTALQLGGVIVEEQHDSTEGTSTEALSCYDLYRVEAVKTAVDNLAKQMVADNDQNDFKTIRGHTSEAGTNTIHYFYADSVYEWMDYPFFDLYHLCERIKADTTNFSVTARNFADTIMTSVDEMIVYSFACSDYSGFVNGRNGIYIFAPDGDRIYDTNPHWAYQWWYNKIDTDAWWPGGHYYGKLLWCIDGATVTTGNVGNWFEMLDSWYDPTNLVNGGVNGYRW